MATEAQLDQEKLQAFVAAFDSTAQTDHLVRKGARP